MFGNTQFITTTTNNKVLAKQLVSDPFNNPSRHFLRAAVSLVDVTGSTTIIQKQELCTTATRPALSGFGGLEVACWPLVRKFAGSNPAEAVGFFRAKKSSARLPSEGK